MQRSKLTLILAVIPALASGSPANAAPGPAQTSALAGDARSLALQVDGAEVALPRVDLGVRAAGDAALPEGRWNQRPAPRLRWRADGVRLLFDAAVRRPRADSATPTPVIRGWRLRISRLERAARVLIHERDGAGAPPAQLLWDGRVGGRRSLAAGVYEAQLELLVGPGSGASSPRRLFTVDVDGELQAPPPARPDVTVDGAPLRLDRADRFSQRIGHPHGPVIVALVGPRGERSWTTVGGLPAPIELAPSTRLLVEGSLDGAALAVDGNPVDASLLQLAVSRVAATGRARHARHGVSLGIHAAAPLAARWQVEIADAKGNRLRTIRGGAPVPPRVAWDGRDDSGQALDGWAGATRAPAQPLSARLKVEDERGNVGYSPPLTIEAPASRTASTAADPAHQATVLVDGVPIRLQADGSFRERLPHREGAALLVDLQNARGARAIYIIAKR